jgi:hypothetical protein
MLHSLYSGFHEFRAEDFDGKGGHGTSANALSTIEILVAM